MNVLFESIFCSDNIEVCVIKLTIPYKLECPSQRFMELLHVIESSLSDKQANVAILYSSNPRFPVNPSSAVRTVCSHKLIVAHFVSVMLHSNFAC